MEESDLWKMRLTYNTILTGSVVIGIGWVLLSAIILNSDRGSGIMASSEATMEYFEDRYFVKKSFVESTIRPALTNRACVLHIDLITNSLNLPDESYGNQCSLFVVEEPTDLIKPLPSARSPPRYALLKAASSFEFIELNEFMFGIISAFVYSRLHGYRLFLYILPPPEPFPRVELTLWSKYYAVLSLLDFFDQSNAPEEAFFFSDMDGWMDLTRDDAFSLDAVIDRDRARRGGNPRDVDILLQGEPVLCSCLFIMWRTQFVREFWRDVRQMCVFPSILTGICAKHPYEQMGFYWVLLHTMNNTNSFSFRGDVCFNGNALCQMRAINSTGSNLSYQWPHLAFLPQDGTPDAPQLHSCLKKWGGCDDRDAIFYHTGHTNWHDSQERESAESEMRLFLP